MKWKACCICLLLLTLGASLSAESEPSNMDIPRIASVWVLPGASNWPYIFDLVAYTLFAHDMQWGLDLHVLTPDIPTAYTAGEKSNWPFLNNVYFHTVTDDDWHRRIYERLDVNVSYKLTNRKKVADFKPMYAELFPDILSPDKYDYWIYGDYDGYFGAFDAIFDYAKIPLYEVISGYTPKRNALDTVDFFDTAHHALGSWTMLRNNHKVNKLFRRSPSLDKVMRSGDTQYSFDENTHFEKGMMNFHDILDVSIDISRCCASSTVPIVRRNAGDKIVIDMKGDYVRDGVSVKVRWQKNHPITLSVDGHIGMKKVYRQHSTQGLFLHFLQWKFIRPRLFNEAVKQFISNISKRKGGYMSLDCFEFITYSTHVDTTEALYSYEFC